MSYVYIVRVWLLHYFFKIHYFHVIQLEPSRFNKMNHYESKKFFIQPSKIIIFPKMDMKPENRY